MNAFPTVSAGLRRRWRMAHGPSWPIPPARNVAPVRVVPRLQLLQAKGSIRVISAMLPCSSCSRAFVQELTRQPTRHGSGAHHDSEFTKPGNWNLPFTWVKASDECAQDEEQSQGLPPACSCGFKRQPWSCTCVRMLLACHAVHARTCSGRVWGHVFL